MFYKILLASLPLSMLFADEPPPKVPEGVKKVSPEYKNEVFVRADFIYWLAQQEGNEYAATGAAITVPGTLDPNTMLTPGPITGAGKVYKPNTQMEPGFKVALGVDLAHGRWDLFLQYTNLFSRASGSVSSDNLNAGILPLFSYTPNNSILDSTTYAVTTGATGFVSAASSHWNLHFNNFDLELGKSVQLHHTFSLRPHLGLKGNWQTELFQSLYTVSSFSSLDVLGNNKVVSKQSSWGVGPRAGLDNYWGAKHYFGIFANTAVSLLWSHFTNTATSYDTNSTGDYADVLIGDQTLSLHTMNPVVELELGVRFNWAFGKEKQRHFILDAGWEGQVWFFQNMHSSAIADTSLILQGLTAGARLDF